MPELSREEIRERYNHDDLPKIKNWFWNGACCFAKIAAICFFGLGAVFLAIFVFPFIRLFAARKKDFGVVARAYVSHTFRNFLGVLNALHVSTLKTDNPEAYKNIRSKIIVANHPSLLDFVYIMSLAPNSTCVVRGGLTKTPLRGVIKQAYITNSSNFDDICAECKKLTDIGCNVIIFPEGTRSPRHGTNSYKKGAARLALYCGVDVQPIFIGGSDKYGLGKHDPLWSYNHVESYLYDFKLLQTISINDYKELSESIAAKRLTEKIENAIRSAGNEYAKTYAGKTLNNF